MFTHLNALMTTAVGADGGRRSRRGGRRHHRRAEPAQAEESLGKWIWIDEPRDTHNSYVLARKTFKLSGQPAEAVIKTSASHRYKLYVNGEYVGQGPVRGGHGCVYYDDYDIAHLLRKGDNVIALIAHHQETGAPGFICKAEIVDGEDLHAFGTDETWLVRKAEDRSPEGVALGEGIGFQEVCEAAKLTTKWNEVKLNARGWTEAVVVEESSSVELLPRDVPFLTEQIVLPKAVLGEFSSPGRPIDTPMRDLAAIISGSPLSTLSAGSVKGTQTLLEDSGEAHIRTARGDTGVVLLLDFGREVRGNIEVGIAGSGSGIIDLAYGETLDDGRVKPTRGGLDYVDRIKLHKGALQWSSFEPRAFRYIQLEFRRCSRTVALDYVRVNELVYPAEQSAGFECSDRTLNQIWDAAVTTTRLCMEDVFLCSPRHPRTQEWTDARILARAAFYVCDDTSLIAQGLRQLARGQRRDGSMPGVYPTRDDSASADTPLLWVFSILDYYAFTDDLDLVRELYGNVRDLIKWYRRFAGPEGMLGDVPGDLFIEETDLDPRGEVTTLNCLYYQALRVAAVMASITGRDDEAEGLMDEARVLKSAINKYLYSTPRGLYAQSRTENGPVERFSKQANILAALFDIPDQYQRATIYRQAISGSLADISTTCLASLLLEALYAGERHDEALEMMRSRWQAMLNAGASTFWEAFSGDGALCRGWSVGPARDLLAEYVGIKPALGSSRYTVEPHIADLRWARGSMRTPKGDLVVDWRIERGVFSLKISVPDGLTVDAYPPTPAQAAITVDGKSQVSRVFTFEGGQHIIRVRAARPAKSAPIDQGLEPAPFETVEVLGNLPAYGRRRLRGDDRPRRRKTEDSVADTEAEAEDYDEITGVEPATEPEEQSEQVEKKPRRRGRRGGRGRRRAATSESEAVSEPDAETSPASDEATAPTTPEDAPLEEEEKAPRRSRRSRRGGRGRKRPSPEGTAPTIEPAPAAEDAQAQPDSPVADESDPEKKPRRRGRRGGRGRSSASSEDAEAVTSEAASAERQVEAAPAPEPEKKPRRRGTRGGRPRSSNADGDTPVEPSEETPPSPTVTPPHEERGALDQETVEKKPRRRRSPRKPVAENQPPSEE